MNMLAGRCSLANISVQSVQPFPPSFVPVILLFHLHLSFLIPIHDLHRFPYSYTLLVKVKHHKSSACDQDGSEGKNRSNAPHVKRREVFLNFNHLKTWRGKQATP